MAQFSKWNRFFGRACSDRTRSNGFKVKEVQFRLDIRKEVRYKEVLQWVVRPLHRLSREMVGDPSMQTFQARLDEALSSLI